MTHSVMHEPTQYVPQVNGAHPAVDVTPDPGLAQPYPGSEARPRGALFPRRPIRWNGLGQLLCAVVADVGLYQVGGLGITLLVTGVVGAVAFGLREAGYL